MCQGTRRRGRHLLFSLRQGPRGSGDRQAPQTALGWPLDLAGPGTLPERQAVAGWGLLAPFSEMPTRRRAPPSFTD